MLYSNVNQAIKIKKYNFKNIRLLDHCALTLNNAYTMNKLFIKIN